MSAFDSFVFFFLSFLPPFFLPPWEDVTLWAGEGLLGGGSVFASRLITNMNLRLL